MFTWTYPIKFKATPYIYYFYYILFTSYTSKMKRHSIQNTTLNTYIMFLRYLPIVDGRNHSSLLATVLERSCTHTHIHTHVHIEVYTRMLSCIGPYIHIYVSTYTSIQANIHIHIHVYTFTHTVYLSICGRGISPSQGRYLHTEQHKHRHPYLEWDSIL
jgi:hypothetical protein